MGPALVLTSTQFAQVCWNFERTYVFGVVNATPDSFHDGGRFAGPRAAVEHGLALAQQGADAVDVGGESTRPESTPVDLQQELRRVIPVVEGLAAQTRIPISIDTYKAQVAREAIAAGAAIVNDVSGGLLDEDMLGVVARSEAAVVLGHLRGRPQSMQRDVSFTDVVAEVTSELRQRVRAAVRAGVDPQRIWVDPGIGFGKTSDQSLSLLNALGRIRGDLGYPLMVGPSRKSFIGAVTGQPVAQRLMGTCAACSAAVVAGADALRVHDVADLLPGIRVADAIVRANVNATTPGGWDIASEVSREQINA